MLGRLFRVSQALVQCCSARAGGREVLEALSLRTHWDSPEGRVRGISVSTEQLLCLLGAVVLREKLGRQIFVCCH